MAAFCDILHGHICGRQQYISAPVAPSCPDLFPTNVVYCVGKKCVGIATISIQHHPVAGSTQVYQFSKPVICYIASILLMVVMLATITAFWATRRYTSRQGGKKPKSTGTNLQKGPTDIPSPKSRDTNAVNPKESRRWHMPSLGLYGPQNQSLSSSSRTAQGWHSPVTTDNPADPPSTTATSPQANLNSQSSLDEEPKFHESTGNITVSSKTFCDPRSIVPALITPDPDTLSPNLNPVATGPVTPDAATKAALAKEENGEHLAHKEGQSPHDYKIKAGLKQPPNQPSLEAILAKKRRGKTLTPGQRAFLRKNRPRQDGDVVGSIAGSSDSSTAASVASTTEGSELDELVADGVSPG
ncbi:MAG: hypothetical protein L6R35_003523 [Caloplaca aegaea]|nr:MAG: hypothetical protein L6R35_003523 [Caloplaca aegaea]